MICDLFDKRIKTVGGGNTRDLIAFVKDRPGHDFRYAIDTTKISKELGWTPQESFAFGLQRTINWYLGNGDWWQSIRSGAYRSYYEEQYSQNSQRLKEA